MPYSSLFADLAANATSISFTSLGNNGTMQNCLLSATSNPFGTTDANGRYLITIPANKSLTISSCRLVGTLLISAPSGGKVAFNGPVECEPGAAGGSTIFVSGTSCDVTLQGSNTWLSEATAGVNFNPAGNPYLGATDTTLDDDYPPQFNGIIQVTGGSTNTLALKANTYVNGTVIADCPVTTSSQTTLVQDPTIFANPPPGYATGSALNEVPGTWVWDTTP